jgi:hypothetical protein
MDAPASKQSFFSFAAWYCWIAPLVATGVATAVFVAEGDTRYHTLGDPAVSISFWVCISGLALASISHKGLERNGGESVRRLVITEPHENTPRRHSEDRL